MIRTQLSVDYEHVLGYSIYGICQVQVSFPVCCHWTSKMSCSSIDSACSNTCSLDQSSS
jgi:hypothetical protein